VAGYRRIDLPAGPADDFASAVIAGLSSPAPSLPCRFLYDAVGSRLFEAICATEAYYPTRCEREILIERAGELAGDFGAHVVVDLGSGNAEKTRVLLGAWPAPARYLAVDLDPTVLDRAGEHLCDTVPEIEVLAIAGDYTPGLDRALEVVDGPALVLFLGGNVGNFTREVAARMLSDVRRGLRPGDALLVGIDLRKDGTVIEEAYDDPAGVTAAFSRNLLARMQRELGAEVDPRGFAHEALYDSHGGVVRTHLVSRVDQVLRVCGQEFRFLSGDRVHTEDAFKYDRQEIETLAAACGTTLQAHWRDGRERYSLNLLTL
jgi:L-histidine N-alpha-methyltransferase